MKQRLTPLLLLMVIALVAAACGGDDTTDDTGAPDTDGPVDALGEWNLVDGTHEGTEIPIQDVGTITLEIVSEDGALRIAGTSGCNSYGGGLEIADDNSVNISEVFSTMMACEPQEIMDAEATYLSALEAVDAIDRTDDTLTLTGSNTELTFTSSV